MKIPPKPENEAQRLQALIEAEILDTEPEIDFDDVAQLQGPGISEANRARLFGRFEQLDATDKRQHGGTGLGLAICKAIVEQHGGTIGLESEIGKGSTFFVELNPGPP